MTNTQTPAQMVMDDQICDALRAENVYPHPSIVRAIRKLLSAQSQPVQELTDDKILEIASSVWTTIPKEWWQRDRNEISKHCIQFARALLTGRPK